MRYSVLFIFGASFILIGFLLWGDKHGSGLGADSSIGSEKKSSNNFEPRTGSEQAIVEQNTETPVVRRWQKPKMTREDFLAVTDKIIEKMPLKKNLQALDEAEVHSLPIGLAQVGEGLAKVAEALAENPTLSRDAFLFYEKCASENDFADSVRALCYANYFELAGKNSFSMLSESQVPAAIKTLAKSL